MVSMDRIPLRGVILVILLSIVASFEPAFGQHEIWLDKPFTNWNASATRIPRAPKPRSDSMLRSRCRGQERPATTAGDRQVRKMGWELYGPLLVFGKTSVIRALSDVDGMCRPMSFQLFVFVGDKFAGTLAPSPMDSRSDGSASEIRLLSGSRIEVEFSRYTPADPLCCPSKKQSVDFTVERGVVRPAGGGGGSGPANTTADESTIPAEGIVTGTVEYRERIALLPEAQLEIKVVDATRQDSPPLVVGEETVTPTGNVPIQFTVRYQRGRIEPAHEYRLEVHLRSGDRVWENAEMLPVITNGVSAGVRVMLRQSK